jgi:hypothetical protein
MMFNNMVEALSRGIGKGPAFRDGSVVSDDLSMSCPDSQDGLFGTDACSSGISSGPEPVVLGSSSCPSSDAWVGDSIDGLSKDSVKEADIVRDETGSEVMAEVIAAIDDGVDVLITIRNNNLERAKKFLAAELEILDELFDADLNCSGLIGAVDFRDVVLDWKRFSSEKQFRSRDLQDLIDVVLDSLVVPGQHRANSQIIKFATLGKLSNCVSDALLHPIFVDKHARLSWAFLASSSIGILIALPGDVFEIVDIRAKDFPVEACIFDSDSASGFFSEVLGNFAAAGKLDDSEVGMIDDVLHVLVGAVEEVDVVGVEAAGMSEEKELLDHDGYAWVTFQ